MIYSLGEAAKVTWEGDVGQNLRNSKTFGGHSLQVKANKTGLILGLYDERGRQKRLFSK